MKQEHDWGEQIKAQGWVNVGQPIFTATASPLSQTYAASTLLGNVRN